MKGSELVEFISNNSYLLHCDVAFTIKELLKRGIIKPSTLIDSQVEVLEEEKHKLKCHFEDSVVSCIQLFGGNYKGKEYEDAKKRFIYNTSFSKLFPHMTGKLSDEDKKYWSDFFKNNYGFKPEEEL